MSIFILSGKFSKQKVNDSAANQEKRTQSIRVPNKQQPPQQQQHQSESDQSESVHSISDNDIIHEAPQYVQYANSSRDTNIQIVSAEGMKSNTRSNSSSKKSSSIAANDQQVRTVEVYSYPSGSRSKNQEITELKFPSTDLNPNDTKVSNSPSTLVPSYTTTKPQIELPTVSNHRMRGCIQVARKSRKHLSLRKHASETSNRTSASTIAVEDLPKLQHNIFKFNSHQKAEDSEDSGNEDVDNAHIIETKPQVPHRIKRKSTRQIGRREVEQLEQHMDESKSLTTTTPPDVTNKKSSSSFHQHSVNSLSAEDQLEFTRFVKDILQSTELVSDEPSTKDCEGFNIEKIV